MELHEGPCCYVGTLDIRHSGAFEKAFNQSQQPFMGLVISIEHDSHCQRLSLRSPQKQQHKQPFDELAKAT